MTGVSTLFFQYVRRFRMEVDFADVRLPPPALTPGYEFVSWSGGMVERHAAVKFTSFQSEPDSHVFPSLGEARGCRRLMEEMSHHENFLPAATWLLHFRGSSEPPLAPQDCATIQGIVKPHRVGSIQNVGVSPEHRGLGLGRALVLQSLHGFRRSNMRRVYLEVTAENEAAVHLYRSVGFRVCRTMYQQVDREAALGW
ncbi:MAG: GNAT family N-acetyltransferase [Planctomycetaceae bacterium]